MNTDEMAVYIGERLLSETEQFRRLNYLDHYDDHLSMTIGDFTRWLSSPDGIHAVKLEMIERGHNHQCGHYGKDKHGDNIWGACFPKPEIFDANWGIGSEGRTEAEAVINAAYKALKAEEDKAND